MGNLNGADRRSPALLAAACLVSLALLFGCTNARELRDSTCTVSSKLVPTCGVLWGYSTGARPGPEVAAAQDQLGRRFDFVYAFHDINDELPTVAERRLSHDGTLLHLSIDPRDFASSDRTTVTWAAVARGEYDTSLRKQARGVAELGVPVFVTFDHEVDQPSKSALGSPTEFKAAWRHVHQVFINAGATRAVWVWVVLGWPETFARAASLWPGNDVVDWISWDVYNASGCRKGTIDSSRYVSFADAMLPFYRWLHANGSEYDIDADKPLMISETGTVRYPGDSKRSAHWYAQIPGVLKRYRQIKALALWTRVGNGVCDYRFDDDPTITQGLKTAGLDPFVDSLPDANRPRP